MREDRIRDYAEYVSDNAKEWVDLARRRTGERMKAAGYTERVWHGTEGDDFNVFQFTSGNHKVPAAYFTYRMETAQNYAALRSMDVEDLDSAKPNVREFYVNPEDADPGVINRRPFFPKKQSKKRKKSKVI